MLDMEDMDDFGDLYADAEVHTNNGIGKLEHFYVNPIQNCDIAEGVVHLNSQKKDAELHSSSEELILYDQFHHTNCEGTEAGEKDSNMPCTEKGEKNPLDEDGSDSEDDLHIVLNEEDCRVFPPHGVNLGNVAREGGSEDDDDDDDDDLVIVTEADKLVKDPGLEQSVEGPGAERVSSSKGAYVSPYSQFKYIRPYAAALTSNLKTTGSVGRSDWDANGGNQVVASCSVLDTSASNLGIHSLSHKRFEFHLPRNRSILDVNIDTFEWKPWRYPGVDMTDFFNFGLDEKSWKSYCKDLQEHIWKQTNLHNKIPVYQASSLNKAYEDEFLQKTEAYEAVAGVFETTKVDQVSNTMGNDYRSTRNFEKPKGRAIQVEDGSGERLPSMDVRRPRYRDADVVIQIPMQETAENSSVSDGKLDLENNFSGERCENGDLEIDVSRSGYRLGGGDLDHPRTKVVESVPEKTDEKVENDYINDAKIISELGKDKFVAESASCDQIRGILSRSDHQSHSEASKSGFAIDMDKVCEDVRSPSSCSLIESGYNRSKRDSRSNTSKTKSVIVKNSSPEQSLNESVQVHHGRLQLSSLTELEFSVDGAKLPTDYNNQVDRKSCNDRNKIRRRTSRRRLQSDDNNINETDSGYGEPEMLSGSHGRKYLEKQRRNSSNGKFHSNCDPHVCETRKLRGRRDSIDVEYPDEKFTQNDDEMKQREYYFCEGRHTVGGKESDRIIPVDVSFRSKRKRCLHQSRKNSNDKQHGREVEDDRECSEHMHREKFIRERYTQHMHREKFIRERYTQHMHHYGRDDFILEYERFVPHPCREKIKSDRRSRDAHNPSFHLDDSWRAVKDDAKYTSHHVRVRSTHNCSEDHFEDVRRWCDSYPLSSQPSDMLQSDSKYENDWRPDGHCGGFGRSTERYVDDRRLHDFQDEQYIRYREESPIFVKRRDFRCQFPLGRSNGFDVDCYDNGGFPACPENHVFDERKRYRFQWTGEEACFAHQEKDDSYNPEASFLKRNSRHKHRHPFNDVYHDRKYLDGVWLEKSEKKMMGKNVPFKARKCIGSPSDVADWGKREAMASRCKEPVDLYCNGWERKYPRRCNVEVKETRYDDTSNVVKDAQAASQKSDIMMKAAHKLEGGGDCLNDISSMIRQDMVPYNLENLEGSNDKWLDKFPIEEHDDDSALEEGQLVEEPGQEDFNQWKEEVVEKPPSLSVEVCRFEVTEEIKSKSNSKDAPEDNKDLSGYDENWILETLAKMERRRERFKNPIALKKDPDKNLSAHADVVEVEALEAKQQRPARKRLWGAL